MIVPGWQGKTNIDGYDPEALTEQWAAAEGADTKTKLASLRKGTRENASHYVSSNIPREAATGLENRLRAILPKATVRGFFHARDYDQALRRVEVLEALISQYPDQASKIKLIVYTHSPAIDDIAWWRDGKLVFNTQGQTYEELARWHNVSPGTDPDFFATVHEFGHIMKTQAAMAEIIHLVEQITGLVGQKALDAISGVSPYAGMDFDELLAEAFATMVVWPQGATDIEKSIFEILTGGQGT